MKLFAFSKFTNSQKIVGLVAAAVIVSVIALFVWTFNAIGPAPNAERSPNTASQADCERVSQRMKCELCTLTDEEKRIQRMCIDQQWRAISTK